MSDFIDATLASELGIHTDGLQTRTWTHGRSWHMRCVLCGEEFDMEGISTTLFDGRQMLGDLCETCLRVGPVEAATRARAQVEAWRAEATELDDLADNVARIDPASWPSVTPAWTPA